MNSVEITNENLRTRVQRLRVPAGFISAILFVFASQPGGRSLIMGIPVALCGAIIRAWASGHLRKNLELAMAGPYAYTRNPLYFGSFVMALGCAIAGGSWWLGATLLGIFLLIYLPVMQAESEYMQTLFAGKYENWAANVPLFIPRLTPYRSNSSRGFALQQYMQHREYRALIGLALVLSLLVLKAVLL
jgi:protein-S-isoprenylcysteine O-methyltransferase Ste14